MMPLGLHRNPNDVTPLGFCLAEGARRRLHLTGPTSDFPS
jgi:hypothetical protein